MTVDALGESLNNDLVELFNFNFGLIGVCLPDDPEGNAKLMLSILDCLPRSNRVSFSPYFVSKSVKIRISGNIGVPVGPLVVSRFRVRA